MHGDRTRLWVAAETAVKCADHNPLLIDQATKTIENPCAGKACLISSQYPCDALQCCICRFIISAAGIMLSFRSAMIKSDPTTTRATISTPKASAITLLVLSGPVVTCRKNTRWTPICAIARTVRPREIPPPQSSDVLATQNDVALRTTARANPIVSTST